MTSLRVHTAVALALLLTSHAFAAEVVRLSARNWDKYAPHGKEVDAIYGDLVLRNDKVTIVIADAIAGRHANLTVKEVAGCIIDMTRRDTPGATAGNDQLSAFYANATRTPYRKLSAGGGEAVMIRIGDVPSSGDNVWIEVLSDPKLELEELDAFNKPRIEKDKVKPPAKPKPLVRTRYTLADGWDFVLIETTYRNDSGAEMTVEFADSIRADRTFDFSLDKAHNFAIWHDRWFGQAYGLSTDKGIVAPAAAPQGRAPAVIYHELEGKRTAALEADANVTVTRRLFCAANTLDLIAMARAREEKPLSSVKLTVQDSAGGVPDADVIATTDGKPYGRGRTDAKGKLDVRLAPGTYQLEIYAIGRTKQLVPITVAEGKTLSPIVVMDDAGYVVGAITDAAGKPIPCKVQFTAVQPEGEAEPKESDAKTKEGDANAKEDERFRDPFFFPDSGDFAVHNCVYSHTGQFKQAIGPGKYKVIISYGPEHDALFKEIEVVRGQETLLAGKVIRSVDSKGWISTDFHSHSSPSGDNTASQLGRVLNLISEHIEFAPCTEHQRVDSYEPHLYRLKAEHLLATCTGMELTGTPLPLNHQNVFPLPRKPNTQDGGGPQIDYDPRVQIERLYMFENKKLWENKKEKVVQQNHPDILKMFFDKDGDKKADGGLGMAPFMDVIEVHPPSGILAGPTIERDQKTYPNTIFNWLVILNKGFRIPGVVNTDAHYNFHGSGWLRNYVKSPTDDTAKVKVLDVVRETNAGHIVMTNGPFMEVTASDADFGRSEPPTFIPGDELKTKNGRVELWVRVQCPNWFDINRVQVLINGRPDEKLNFTRKTTPAKFSDKTVRFEAVMTVELKTDAHIIVTAQGEGLTMGPVMGPRWGKEMPVAVSNPIFVDVDGKGFKSNGDELGAALPK